MVAEKTLPCEQHTSCDPPPHGGTHDLEVACAILVVGHCPLVHWVEECAGLGGGSHYLLVVSTSTKHRNIPSGSNMFIMLTDKVVSSGGLSMK